jgi:ribose transport system permease protein
MGPHTTVESAEPVLRDRTSARPSLRTRVGAAAGEITYRYALVLVWLGVVVIFSALEPSLFPTSATFRTIFSTQSALAVVTLGLLLPLIVGEFDLSIGATLGLAAILVVVLNVEHGVPVGVAVLAALAAGLLIGLLNGFFVVVIGVDGLVATLGMATLVTGIGYAVSDYQILSGVSDSLVNAVTTDLLGLPLGFWYGLALCIGFWYVLRYTPLGRYLIFTGASRDVARLSGLPVRELRLGAFVVGAGIASLAGVLLAGTLGGEDPSAGVGFLLPAYAAAFLGATVVTPGQFNPWGALVAVYFLMTGITGLQLLGLADWIQDVFYGATLIVAVTLSHLAARRRRTTQ